MNFQPSKYLNLAILVFSAFLEASGVVPDATSYLQMIRAHGTNPEGSDVNLLRASHPSWVPEPWESLVFIGKSSPFMAAR